MKLRTDHLQHIPKYLSVAVCKYPCCFPFPLLQWLLLLCWLMHKYYFSVFLMHLEADFQKRSWVPWVRAWVPVMPRIPVFSQDLVLLPPRAGGEADGGCVTTSHQLANIQQKIWSLTAFRYLQMVLRDGLAVLAGCWM